MNREQRDNTPGSGRNPPSKESLLPSISLPKGGGAIQGIGEKFGANPVTGTGSMSVPLAASPCRFGPLLSLVYNSGAGNGPFGLGWTMSAPSITRKTDRGLPRYFETADAQDSDVFILSDVEDLVPANSEGPATAVYAGVEYQVRRYRPRIEGLFARIERWLNPSDGLSFWRTISRENVTSYYGVDSEGRVADTDDPRKIFKWLLQRTHDDKGNACVYRYKAEDGANIANTLHEAGRSGDTQRYLKRVDYGNVTSYYPDPPDAGSLALPANWYYHVLFDYGEHDAGLPLMDEQTTWPARADAFSTYRAAFEIRTRRLCRRVLMFHEFPELGSTPCLVKATELTYAENPTATTLSSVRHRSYRRESTSSYFSRALPPVEFTYSEASIDDTVRDVGGDALENLPAGADVATYQWVDLDSEGSLGILTSQAEGWFYKRNVSNLPMDAEGNVRAAFEPLQCVATRPSHLDISVGLQQLADLGGEGQQCLVDFSAPKAGFYARGDDFEWEAFTPFESAANVDFADPNLRMLDLNGDGLPDILLINDEVFRWHPSRGRQGFAAAEDVHLPNDQDESPALVFADGTQSIFLADFSGDGLTDLVRIRNGEICYWPNLGYGRFGGKITMSNAPLFDPPDQFDQKRIRLADINGSGTTDIIYLGERDVSIYSNESGNAWAPARMLTQLDAPSALAAVSVVDLLGNGTGCLVWSSPLPGDAGRQMRYVDLMGGEKPYLLTGVRNNLGAETRVRYVASTKFYLQDRAAGTPWITRLPFPVHVVEQVEVRDAVSRTRFVTRYAYHHGYYDGIEREFRGFGLVEQWDTDAFAVFAGDPAANIDEATALPPTLTRSWFHTGAYLQGARVSLLFKDDYYREPNLDQAAIDTMLLPDTVLPTGLSADEEREACRSLKGSLLRQEIYALDGTSGAAHPYTVSERNFIIKTVQPLGVERHAVFFTHARETVDYHYERAMYDVGGVQRCDPRVSHSMTLAVDEYGNAVSSVSIAYGRRFDSTDPTLRAEDIAAQKRIAATTTEASYTNAIEALHAYRSPAPATTRTFELLKITPNAALANVTNLFRFDEMRAIIAAAGDGTHDIPYEDVDSRGATGTGPYRRLLGEGRVLYRRNDLTGALALGSIESLSLPFESYQVAFTAGLLGVLSARISAADATALLLTEGRYRDLDGDGRLWVPSGITFLSSDPANPDVLFARAHRYLPQCARDPFGNVSRVTYDVHEQFVAQTVDALGNTVSARFDYRVLAPLEVTDANGNRGAAAFDVLGQVVASVVMGKESEPDGIPKGDLLQGFTADLTDAQIDAFLTDPRARAAELLGLASSRVVYDVDRFFRSGEPAFVASILRETHVSDLEPGRSSNVAVSVAYSDGLGRSIQRKSLAAPGPVEQGGADVDPRWTASGWTIFNNKGKAIRQYESFFTATHRFEFAVQRGVSPTFFYDPVGRVIATLHVDHTYQKIRFDPWWQEIWDGNDTVTLDPAADPDIAAWVTRMPAMDYSPSWHALRTNPANAALATELWPDAWRRDAEADAANKAAAHANTPAVGHFDTQGHTFVAIADNGPEGKQTTRNRLDVEGNLRAVVDTLDRVVMIHDYDLLGRGIHQASMEAGERWMLSDVAGNSIRSWDSRGHAYRSEYDPLHRPLRSFVRGADAEHPGTEILFARMEYGEGQPDDVARNLRMQLLRQFDSAGVITSERFDFKGNLTAVSRQLTRSYKGNVDWSSNQELAAETFNCTMDYDAMGRLRALTTADASVYRPNYDEGGHIVSIGVRLRGAAAETPFISAIEYDAKGQRQRIEYANGVTTEFNYDPQTFRVLRIGTQRSADQAVLQDLNYASDPAGNITRIRDAAQQTIYFNGAVVEPNNNYRYDAVYRLVHAEGREHIGQLAQPQSSWDDVARVRLPHPSDGQAMRLYTEDYSYDPVGNLLALAHQAVNGNWNRAYTYDEASQIDAARKSNRLSGTAIASGPESYHYDAHGNMTSMPHLPLMQWNFRDQLAASSRQVVNGGTAETTYYVYSGAGQRTRKITERQNGTRKQERIYLGGFELYREYDGSGNVVTLERETLHVMDDAHRIALVETRTDDQSAPVLRYQFGNHLDSATLELDESGRIITYEEYFPYGSTSYQAGRTPAEVSQKRYRYAARERDEETGLGHHSARYLASWLGRWASSDPTGIADGPNTYAVCSCNPTRLSDRSGLGGEETKVVRPTVVAELKARHLPFAEEVSFDLLGPNGKDIVVSGRFDVVFYDPNTKEIVIPELKGKNLEALTVNQEIYKPVLESGKATIRITGQQTGTLHIAPGKEIPIPESAYTVVGIKNLKEFRVTIADMAGGGRFQSSVMLKNGEMELFKTEQELKDWLIKQQRSVPEPPRQPKGPKITDHTDPPPKPRSNYSSDSGGGSSFTSSSTTTDAETAEAEMRALLRNPQAGSISPRVLLGIAMVPVAIAFIKGTTAQRKQIVGSEVGTRVGEYALARTFALFGIEEAPPLAKIPAAILGAFIGQCAMGGECNPITATKTAGVVVKDTVVHAYSSPRGYLETMWDFSPLGMNVNAIRSFIDLF